MVRDYQLQGRRVQAFSNNFYTTTVIDGYDRYYIKYEPEVGWIISSRGMLSSYSGPIFIQDERYYRKGESWVSIPTGRYLSSYFQDFKPRDLLNLAIEHLPFEFCINGAYENEREYENMIRASKKLVFFAEDHIKNEEQLEKLKEMSIKYQHEHSLTSFVPLLPPL